MSCSLFCGWKVDDEDDMEDEEVDDSGEDWVESSPLDLKTAESRIRLHSLFRH